jgi:iron complex transport system substrate-binding protein
VKRLGAWNGAGFAAALVASVWGVWAVQPNRERHNADGEPSEATSATPDSAATSQDHDGTPIPRRDYRRIVSGSTISDAILLEISEPDRVVAFTGYSARNAFLSFHYAGRRTVEHIDDLEHILSLHPDLVFVNGFGDPRPVARLREAGLIVFNLGEMRGLSTLISDIHDIAEMLGHPERGDRFARAIVEQMGAVAADVPESKRPRAIYLSAYGGVLLGGAQGTSYHDVLVASGLVDAATAYRDWPHYAPEQILMIDPDMIVTNTGMRSRICEHSGLTNLQACGNEKGIVEVDGALIGDPGPAMVEAARVIRTAVHGPPKKLTMKGTDR